MAAHLQQCVGSFDKIKGIKIADEHVQSETGRQTDRQAIHATCHHAAHLPNLLPSCCGSYIILSFLVTVQTLFFEKRDMTRSKWNDDAAGDCGCTTLELNLICSQPHCDVSKDTESERGAEPCHCVSC